MPNRSEIIHDEASALWREVFAEPPPSGADGGVMLAVILAHLETKPYTRLAQARRARDLVFPNPRDA